MRELTIVWGSLRNPPENLQALRKRSSQSQMGTPAMGRGAPLPSDPRGGAHLVILVCERRKVAAASGRGPQAENVDLRPTAAVPPAYRAKTSLTRCLASWSPPLLSSVIE